MNFATGTEATSLPIAGSVVQLYLAGLIFIAAVLGLGMLLSTIAKTQMQAMQLSFLFLLPFVFLSGYVFPIDGMPRFGAVHTRGSRAVSIRPCGPTQDKRWISKKPRASLASALPNIVW